MDTTFYKIVMPIVRRLIYILYRPEVVGVENIPSTGPVVLAGNHTKWLDPVLLVSVAKKRQIHFLAKIELFSGITKFIAKGMGCIPVNRKIHDKGALSSSVDALNKNLCIGIFPEATINRTDDVIMPFKIGAVKMSHDAHATLIPFTITGQYKLFRKGIKVEFYKPVKVEDDLDKSNELLMKVVSDGIIKNGGKHGNKKER